MSDKPAGVREPREVWVTRDEGSVDKDKLTHIALHQCYPEHNPMHFIERSAYDQVVRQLREYEHECETIKEMKAQLAAVTAERDALRQELKELKDFVWRTENRGG